MKQSLSSLANYILYISARDNSKLVRSHFTVQLIKLKSTYSHIPTCTTILEWQDLSENIHKLSHAHIRKMELYDFSFYFVMLQILKAVK